MCLPPNTLNTAIKWGQFVRAQHQKGRFFLANCLALPEQSSAQKEVDDQKAQEPRSKHRICPSNKAFCRNLGIWAQTARLQLSPLLFHDCYLPLELPILWHLFIWNCTHTCPTWDRVEEVTVMQEQGVPPPPLSAPPADTAGSAPGAPSSKHGWRIGVVFKSWQPLQQPNPSQLSAFSWARPILAVYVRKVGWVEW